MPRGKRRKLEEIDSVENHHVVQPDSTNKDSLCNQNTEEMNSSAKKLKLSDTNEAKLNHTDIKVIPKFEIDAFKKDKDSKDCNFENSLQDNVCIKTELSNDLLELTKLKCEYKVKCETSTTEQNITTLEQPQDALLSNMYCVSREAYLSSSCQTSCHPNISTTGNNYIPNSQATEIGQPSWRGIDSSLPDFTALINKMTDARQFLTTITMQSNIEQAWAQNASFQLMDQFETHYKEIESTFKKKETHHFFHLHKMSRSRKETCSKNYRRLKNAFSNFKSLYQSIKENIYFKKSQMLSESVGLVESDSIAQDKNSEAMKSMAKKQTITSNLKQNHTIIPPAVEYISPQVQPVNVLHESAITNANCSLSSKTVAHQNVAEAYYHHYPYSHVTNSSQPNLPHAEAILPDYTSLINKIADASRFLRSITVKAKNKQLSSQKASFQLIDQFADNFKDVEFNYKNEQQNYDIMFSKLSKLDKTKHRRNFTKLKHLFCDLKNRYLQLNKSISERKMKLNSTDNQCCMEKKQ
uniref:Uncharacterized protein n=1 Tax=Biomphalaria glabrata TaxID=6526 RepID=A0A2C9LJY4_BIOGL